MLLFKRDATYARSSNRRVRYDLGDVSPIATCAVDGQPKHGILQAERHAPLARGAGQQPLVVEKAA